MNARLHIESPTRSRVLDLRGATVFIGRDEGNDVVVPDGAVPPIAAKIMHTDAGYQITTVKPGWNFVMNSVKCKDAVLTGGDTLVIADTRIIFEVLDSTITPPNPQRSFEILIAHISEFAQAVGTERNLRCLLAKLIDILFKIIGGTEAFIFTLSDDVKPQLFISSCDKKQDACFSDTIVQEVLTTGTAICVQSALTDPKYAKSKSVADLKLASVLCCPIIVAQKKIGIIYLGTSGAPHSFTNDNLDVLKIFSIMAGTLIDHVAFESEQALAIEHLAQSDGMVGQSVVMQQVFRDVETVAATDMTVLLLGETGTGKDIVAQRIHAKSSRHSGPFVAVNCSTLKSELLESELFGHKKGSFTGATADSAGLFCAADGGTLFLDEVGEMDIGLQARLLRTIETGSVRAVGSSSERKIDVRIICATNKNILDMSESGQFRSDLYYRLHQFAITLPPLRLRGEDIVHLAYFFLEKYKRQYPHKNIGDFHPATLRWMAVHTWPGNIRELANTIHRAVVTATTPTIEIKGPATNIPTELGFDLDKSTRAFQRDLIEKALRFCSDNREKTAEMLGISRSSLYRMMDSLCIGGDLRG